MTHIVLGTGGGPGSERAATWAADLTGLLHGDLEIVEAYARRSAEESPAVALDLQERSVEELKRWAVAHQLATVPIRTMERDPEEALVLAARDRGADLVVIGSEDEEGVTSFGFGSIAHRLAHHLHCPLIVVPPGDTIIEHGTVVVGVDGSTGSEQALQWASQLAAAVDGRVVAVSSVERSHTTFESSGDGAPGETPAVEQRRVGDAGASIELIERCGSDPAGTLRDVAAESNAALIVVSAKLHHSLGGLLLGAIADHLLHRPTRPLAVLPHGYSGWPGMRTPNGTSS
jgi:nucleotide-binding universal stress UspA family protein